MTVVRAWLRKTAPCLGVLALACASTTPSESSIFHDPALRPGIAESVDDDERALLEQLEDAPAGPLTAGASTFELGASYHSASGRACRRVARAGDDRVACAFSEGWRFVPPIERQPLRTPVASNGPAEEPPAVDE